MKDRVTIHALAVFDAVVKHGGPTKAANAPGVDMSQPAISAQIQVLEKRFGPLFRQPGRTNRRLTELGSVLLAQAGKVIATVDELEAAMTEARKSWDRNLRIGASVTIGEQLLPEYLGRFHANHRDVELQVRIGNTKEITEDVIAWKLDFAIVGQPAEEIGLISHPVIPDRLEAFVAAAPSDPELKILVEQPIVHPKDLSNVPFVLRESGSATLSLALDCLRKSGCDPKHILSLSSNEAVKEAVAQGLGVGLLSSYAIPHRQRDSRFKILPLAPWGCSRTHWLIWRYDRPLIGAPQMFLRDLSGAFPEFLDVIEDVDKRTGAISKLRC